MPPGIGVQVVDGIDEGKPGGRAVAFRDGPQSSSRSNSPLLWQATAKHEAASARAVPVLERASAVSLSHAQGSVTEACDTLNLTPERGHVSPQRVNL